MTSISDPTVVLYDDLFGMFFNVIDLIFSTKANKSFPPARIFAVDNLENWQELFATVYPAHSLEYFPMGGLNAEQIRQQTEQLTNYNGLWV